MAFTVSLYDFQQHNAELYFMHDFPEADACPVPATFDTMGVVIGFTGKRLHYARTGPHPIHRARDSATGPASVCQCIKLTVAMAEICISEMSV